MRKLYSRRMSAVSCSPGQTRRSAPTHLANVTDPWYNRMGGNYETFYSQPILKKSILISLSLPTIVLKFAVWTFLKFFDYISHKSEELYENVVILLFVRYFVYCAFDS